MLGEDRVTMSGKELRWVHVIRQVLAHRLTQKEASTLLGVTDRRIRRLRRRVEQEGDQGLVHRGRGRPSNRRIPEGRKTKILQLYKMRYGDFGPTLAVEKLAEHHGITLSDETLRCWLRARGIDHFTRRKRPHRTWRVRKAHVSELVRLDGSHHDWLEGRGPRCVLMAYIDDASSRVFGSLPASRAGHAGLETPSSQASCPTSPVVSLPRESLIPGPEPTARLAPGTPSYTSVAERVPSHTSRPQIVG